MGKTRPAYPEEFRREAVALVRSDEELAYADSVRRAFCSARRSGSAHGGGPGTSWTRQRSEA